MRLETFAPDTGVRFDRELWHELCSLRFLDDARGACVLGPVGVGKTHLATALGHIAIRRRRTVWFARADQLFRRLKAARLDNTVEAEMRRLARVDLLIIDLSRPCGYPDRFPSSRRKPCSGRASGG